jgi:hypothetical protein
MPLAKDLLRSHTCSIFDALKDAYSDKVNIWEWEQEIAEEAIGIVFACWRNFRDLPTQEFSSDALRTDIATHVGHPLRSGPLQKAFVHPGTPITQVFVPPEINKPEANTSTSNFATDLVRLMDEARWSPEAIADEMGIDWRTVYRHRKGEMFPSLKTIWAYEEALTKRLKRKINLQAPAKRQNASKKSGKRQ